MEETIYRMPLIGDQAPSFTAKTTQGEINFPHDYEGKWVILFTKVRWKSQTKHLRLSFLEQYIARQTAKHFFYQVHISIKWPFCFPSPIASIGQWVTVHRPTTMDYIIKPLQKIYSLMPYNKQHHSFENIYFSKTENHNEWALYISLTNIPHC